MPKTINCSECLSNGAYEAFKSGTMKRTMLMCRQMKEMSGSERVNYQMGLMKCPLKVPPVRYVSQPLTTTATSCLSSRRTATNNETKTTATPTQSPTAGQNTLEKSPVSGRPARKHVQFPDMALEEQKVKSGEQTEKYSPLITLS